MKFIDEKIMEEMDYREFIQLISNIPSCIFFKDKELKYRFSSQRWAQLQSNDLIGKTDLDIRKDQENAIKAMEADREILRSGEGCSYVIRSEVDGKVSYLELHKEPIFDDKHEVMGIVGLINDVTEKTIMEQQILEISKKFEAQCYELEASNDELKVSLDKIEKLHDAHKLFTASMNHELRSPLNGVLGVLQLLSEDSSLGESQKEAVMSAYHASEMMLTIVNELLDFAQMENSDIVIKQEVFDLREVLRALEYVSQNLAMRKNLSFRVEVDAGIPKQVVSDETRFKQIINNFVSNAIKYTDQGEVVLKVAYDKGMLEISCSDTGQGMSEESLKQLFDPYVRFNGEKNKNIQGTGLGLSITKKIVDRMEGEITVDSKLNVGTTFTVKLPVGVCSCETCKHPEAVGFAGGNKNNVLSGKDVTEAGTKISAEGIEEATDLSQLSILCVDDSKVSVDVMARMIEKFGGHAEVVYSAQEALVRIAEKKYDIVFMDHLMPGMDGIQAFQKLRADSILNRNTPVIMMTGNADATSRNFYQCAGVDGYLVKPVRKEQILECIGNVLGDVK